MLPSTPPAMAASDSRLALIFESFRRLTGRPLFELAASAEIAGAMWSAPQVIVAHGTEPDPIFFYGNRLALEVFEMDFEDFTRLPSRLSAEPLAREERQRLLDRVTRNGYIDDYAGVRISAKGRRFRIGQAVVWNLIDPQGKVHGQAAAFSYWQPLP